MKSRLLAYRRMSFRKNSLARLRVGIACVLSSLFFLPQVLAATLTVTSIPFSGVPIQYVYYVGPGTGFTTFSLSIPIFSSATLTAPSSYNGLGFQKWQRNGVDYSTNPSVDTPPLFFDETWTAVFGVPSRTLTVSSSNPSNGAYIQVSPTDKNGQGSDYTQFQRVYDMSTIVTLTAPCSTGNGSVFQKWQRNGVDYSTSLSTQVTMDNNWTMTAVFMASRTLTVASSNPSSGVPITVYPADACGQGNGITMFQRLYGSYDIPPTVWLTAPTTWNGRVFHEWQRNGIPYSPSPSTQIQMNNSWVMMAEYIPAFSGTVAYTGPQTGIIRIVACTNATTWSSPYSTTLTAPGYFEIFSISVPGTYWIRAFRDSTGDGTMQFWEAQGSYPGNPASLPAEGINITLTDPDTVGDGIPDWWRQLYFGNGSMTNNLSCATCDADGDNFNNLQEYLSGTNPTNSASALRITAIAGEGNDIRVTWTCVGGRGYVLQGTEPFVPAGYSSGFVDTSPLISVAAVGESTTNYLDLGAAYAPVLTPPGGQVPTNGMPSTVYITASGARGLADASSNAVSVGSLLMLGTFSISEATIQANFNARNVSAIMSAFTLYSTPFAVGDGIDLPATWDVSLSAAGFAGQKIYLLAIDTPTVARATQLGIFTAPSWVFPDDGGETSIDLEDVTDFVVGTNGGPLTIKLPIGPPYTFDDTARLTALPGRSRFYRVRLVP